MDATSHHGGGMSLSGLFIAAAIAGYLALSAALAASAASRGRRLVALELGSMAVSLVTMGLAAVV